MDTYSNLAMCSAENRLEPPPVGFTAPIQSRGMWRPPWRLAHRISLPKVGFAPLAGSKLGLQLVSTQLSATKWDGLEPV